MTQHDEIEAEDIGSNPAPADPIAAVIGRRLARRDALRGLFAAGAVATLPNGFAVPARAQASDAAVGVSTLGFSPIPAATDGREAVAEGYEVQVVIRWGDPILPDAPAFDPARVTPAAQAGQFGYNNDYVDFFPIPRGDANSERGILAVNNEYTNTNLMWPGMGEGRASRRRVSREQALTEIQAVGMSLVEVARVDGRWTYDPRGALNRRLTGDTPMTVSGPAAGHPRLRTNADPTGTRILGTLNNCAGGNTPWGTVLTAEENFNEFFGGEIAADHPEAVNFRRYGVVRDAIYGWDQHVERFDLAREPNEPNRFGWIVEFDPYDPASVPVKRTALGRFKHEGCHHAVSADGRVVIYMGDDERHDYVYKFVTARAFDAANREANRGLLDDGTLFVARFTDDGTVEWMPLTFGTGPLTEANAFRSQADVVIEARRAADLLGATPMDRPEDVEPNPVTGRVYVMLTNNGNRRPDRLDAANPRAANLQGHVVEIIPPGAGTGRVDHAATTGRWEMFLMAGRPGTHAGAAYHRAVGADDGWLSCPDNCAFDSKGRIWISTDGAPTAARIADALYAADTEGEGRALTKRFYNAPSGAEVCGPLIGPGDRTVFLAIQHPGEDPGSVFEKPSTRWPDFREGVPPRPSVIAIVKRDGGLIGT